MESKNLTKEEQLKLQQDIAITDILLRLTALERILVKKNIINNDEFGVCLQEVLREMHKTLEDAGFSDVAKIVSMKMDKN